MQAYGGKTQYVKWAWEEGVGLSSSNDSFFYDPSIRRYFKNYLKVNLLFYTCIQFSLVSIQYVASYDIIFLDYFAKFRNTIGYIYTS